MARTAVKVDKDKLVSIIEELEKTGSYDGQSSLFAEAANQYTKKYNIKITSSIVYLRVRQYGISIKTKKAKPEPWKFLANPKIEEDKETVVDGLQTTDDLLMYGDTKERKKFLTLAKRVLKGSKSAAIKMNCLQCANFQKEEIKGCQIKSCAWWLFRPYQGTGTGEEECQSQ